MSHHTMSVVKPDGDSVSRRADAGSTEASSGASVGIPGAARPLLQEELSLASSRAPDFQRALRMILRRTCGELDWDFGEAWIPSRDGSVLKPGPVWPRSNPDYVAFRRASRKLGFLPGGGLPGRVWLSRVPIGVEDIGEESAQDFTRRDAALETGFRCAAAVPLIAGALLLAFGLYLFHRSHADLGTNWSITLELREEHELVTGGVYGRVRHPMYTALLVYSLGHALALPNWIAGPSYGVAIALLTAFRLGREERMMLDQSGTDYEAYMAGTNRLIPGIW